jgi:hypothetical protein
LNLDVAKFEIFKPYPGTELYEELVGRNAIRSTRWSDWGIHTPPVHATRGLTRGDIWRARRSAVMWFHLRPKVMIGTLAQRRTRVQVALNARSGWFLLKTLAKLV